jgi:hypothetical protein
VEQALHNGFLNKKSIFAAMIIWLSSTKPPSRLSDLSRIPSITKCCKQRSRTRCAF